MGDKGVIVDILENNLFILFCVLFAVILYSYSKGGMI